MIDVDIECCTLENRKEGKNLITQLVAVINTSVIFRLYTRDQLDRNNEERLGKKGIKRKNPAGNNDSLMTYYPHITFLLSRHEVSGRKVVDTIGLGGRAIRMIIKLIGFSIYFFVNFHDF